ncbi:addiction module toxin, HicA family [Rudanella paleaurantiibacter]|uniref:Addiction module toxin, HicA family n=1 Tax=Rudanella paleaurantiibacter TaxID=2614655 RepID=A0A7J5TV45_9BACT|nr:type II toxin-antitoxin system HicA family toxin [Rudanella paleaurantiibacter]KAB7728014.1 addiction module toxin, HicA family [Rudanella paleaurantiibacter]
MNAAEVIRLLEDKGWSEVRQKGSHRIFKHPEKQSIISVPIHGSKDIATGTLKSILKTAGLK